MASTSLSDYSNFASSDQAIRPSNNVRLAGFALAGASSLSVLTLFSTAIRSKITSEPSSGLFLLSILLSSLFSLLPILFKKSTWKSNLLTHGSLMGTAVILTVFVTVCSGTTGSTDEKVRRMAFLLLVILMSILMTIFRSYSLKRICQLKDHYLFIYLFAEDMLQFILILVRMMPVILVASFAVLPSGSPSSPDVGEEGNNTVTSGTGDASLIESLSTETHRHIVQPVSQFFNFMDKVANYFEEVKESDVYFLFGEDQSDPQVQEMIESHEWTKYLMSIRPLISVSLVLTMISWISLTFLQASESAQRENTLQKESKKSVHLVSFRKRFETEVDELDDSTHHLRTGYSGEESFPSRKRNIFYSLVDGVTDAGDGSKADSTPDIVISSFNQLARRSHRCKSRIIDALLMTIVFLITLTKSVLSFTLPLVFQSDVMCIILVLAYYSFMPLGSLLSAYTAPLMTSVRNFGQQVYQTPYPKRKRSEPILTKTSFKSVLIVFAITVLVTGLAVSILLGERYAVSRESGRKNGDVPVTLTRSMSQESGRRKRDLPVTVTGSMIQDVPVRAVGLIFILILMSVACAFIQSSSVFLIRSRSKSASQFHCVPGSLSSPTPAALTAFQQLHHSHQNQMLTTSSVGQAGAAAGALLSFFLIQYHVTW